MSAQLSLEDAVRVGQEGMNRAADHAGTAWLEASYQWLVAWLGTHPYLRPDDARHGGCPEPVNTWRAFGSVVRRAARDGLIVRDGYAPRASGHLTPGPVWKSLIFEDGPR